VSYLSALEVCHDKALYYSMFTFTLPYSLLGPLDTEIFEVIGLVKVGEPLP